MKKWNIGWGITSNCNMKCKFCYSKNSREITSDINYLDCIKFIDENYKNINSINYGTGENTLCDEWFSLINYVRIKHPCIKQALTTNGYLSEKINNNNKLYQISKNCIDEIDISLDFSEEEKHNNFRGQKNAFKWALDTLKFCFENNITATIVFLGCNQVLEGDNIRGLFEIGKKYKAKLRMNIYRPTNGINEFSKQFIPSYDKIVQTLNWINEDYKILSISDPLFSSILTKSNFEDDPSGINSLRILPNGSITPSTYLISENFREYDIRDKNVLNEIEKRGFVNADLHCIPEECELCKYVNTCKGGVFDRRYLWHSTFSARDPYCPFRLGNYEPSKLLKIATDVDIESVHHGYLPTMFFAAN